MKTHSLSRFEPRISGLRSRQFTVCGSVPRAAGLTFARRHLSGEGLKARQQGRQIAGNDAPERIVIDTEVIVYQAVARGADQPPRDLGMRMPNLLRYVCCRFAGQFQVAHGSHHMSARCRGIGAGSGAVYNSALVRRSASCPGGRTAIRAAFQTCTASFSMKGLNSALSALCVTRSTGRPSRSSR